jgi:hypothetical protein
MQGAMQHHCAVFRAANVLEQGLREMAEVAQAPVWRDDTGRVRLGDRLVRISASSPTKSKPSRRAGTSFDAPPFPPPLAGEGREKAALGGLCRAPWARRAADGAQSVHRDTNFSRYRARLTVPWTGRGHFRRSALYAPPAEKTQPPPIEHAPRPRPRQQHARYQQPFEVL